MQLEQRCRRNGTKIPLTTARFRPIPETTSPQTPKLAVDNQANSTNLRTQLAALESEPQQVTKPPPKNLLPSSPQLQKPSTTKAKRSLDLPSFSRKSPSPNFHPTISPKVSSLARTTAESKSPASLQLPTQPKVQKVTKHPAGDLAPVDPDLQDIATYLYEMEGRLTRQIFWLKKGLRIAEQKIDFQRKLLWFLVFLFSGLLFTTMFYVPQRSNNQNLTVPPNSSQS